GLGQETRALSCQLRFVAGGGIATSVIQRGIERVGFGEGERRELDIEGIKGIGQDLFVGGSRENADGRAREVFEFCDVGALGDENATAVKEGGGQKVETHSGIPIRREGGVPHQYVHFTAL